MSRRAISTRRYRWQRSPRSSISRGQHANESSCILPILKLKGQTEMAVYDILSAESFLEYAFLRWILAPAGRQEIVDQIKPQYEVIWAGNAYRIDYAIVGQGLSIAVELDGFT